MKLTRLALLTVALATTSMTVMANTTINGAGASFPYPIYAKWAEQYQKETGIKVNYQSIGSGGGIRQITAKTVDFGATDAPLTIDELNKDAMIQFPMVMGAIVPVINVPGIQAGQMKLTGKVLADIYLGNIKKWNDPALAKLNPDLKLPNQAIYVIHRSDGSGTTFNFTDYLSLSSPEWKEKIGVGKDITWSKKATTIGGNGNAGVANFVSRTRGAIGYVEYAYAKQNRLIYTQLASKDGKFLIPDMATFQSAAQNADWSNAPGYNLLLNNQPGENSWPMTAATFILIHKDQTNPEKTKAMLDFFDWSYEKGGKLAESLDYVPMPIDVVDMVNSTWKQNLTVNGKAINY